MKFSEAFDLMRSGEIFVVEDMEYRMNSTFPPCLERRDVGQEDWREVIKDYILFTLACDLWEIKK